MNANLSMNRSRGLQLVIAVTWVLFVTTSVQAEIISSAGQGIGFFSHNASFDGGDSGPISTPEGIDLPFFHASGILGPGNVFPQSGSSASGSISHTFGQNGPDSHWVFYPTNVGLNVSDFDGTWNGSAIFGMDYYVDFFMDDDGIGEFPIVMKLPFSGFMPKDHAVSFSASMQWTDHTTDGDPVSAQVTLSDNFAFNNTSPVLEDGNFGGILEASNTWGGFDADPGDHFTVRARFTIQITGPGSGVAAPIGLGFFDQVAIDEGLITIIPEPATLTLLALGGLSAIHRRKA